MRNILIIDDDAALCRSLEIQLRARGEQIASASSASEGMEAVKREEPQLVLLDLHLPDRSGLEVLEVLKNDGFEGFIVLITGAQDTAAAIQAIALGAFDYLRKPLDLHALQRVLGKVEQRFRPSGPEVRVVSPGAGRREIVGTDRKVLEVVKQIGLLSRTRVSVLIEGESGTGKELVARALHEAASPGEPFVAFNCSAVVSTLLESELWGHERGAFTGAERTKIGKMEAAGLGTLFLDEIGDLALDLQAKLLRVLQEREFERVGGLRPIRFSARVVAATHRDINAMVAEGRFREDLAYRLAVARVWVPPLRERRGDVSLLVHHLLSRIASDLGRDITSIEEEALRVLQTHDWPGNIRELENVLTRAVVLARGPVLSTEIVRNAMAQAGAAPPRPDQIATLRLMEKTHIERALHTTGWNVTRTADLLDISPNTLRKKITDYNLQKPG